MRQNSWKRRKGKERKKRNRDRKRKTKKRKRGNYRQRREKEKGKRRTRGGGVIFLMHLKYCRRLQEFAGPAGMSTQPFDERSCLCDLAQSQWDLSSAKWTCSEHGIYMKETEWLNLSGNNANCTEPMRKKKASIELPSVMTNSTYAEWTSGPVIFIKDRNAVDLRQVNPKRHDSHTYFNRERSSQGWDSLLYSCLIEMVHLQGSFPFTHTNYGKTIYQSLPSEETNTLVIGTFKIKHGTQIVHFSQLYFHSMCFNI